MDGLEGDMDGFKRNMDGLKGSMDGLKMDLEGLKAYMESLKEGLTKFLQESVPNGDKVSHETHYENKKNVNHDFRDSIFFFKPTTFQIFI